MKFLLFSILLAGFAAHSGAQNSPLPPGPLFVSPGSLTPIKTPRASYPVEAARMGAQGSVVVRFTISAVGNIETVDVLSGDAILAKAVVNTVKKWKYKPYVVDGAVVPVRTQMRFDFTFKGHARDLPDEEAGLSPGSSEGESATSSEGKPVPVSMGVAKGLLLHQVTPVYPPEARRTGIQGTVILQAIIGKDGLVKKLKAVSGPPQLIPAAIGAVEQWRYQPFSPKGEAVEVQTQITVNFVLER